MSETAVKKDRSCAYCGKGRYMKHGAERCNCTYRFMRMGKSGYESSNTSRETTVAETREVLERQLGFMDPEEKIAFKFSVTRIADDRIAKADAKRKQVGDGGA